MTFVLDFRSADEGGFVTSGELTDTARGKGFNAAEQALAAADSVTFLIHGFNVCRTRGKKKLLHFAKLLPGTGAEAVVGVLWPGDSWARAASYPFEGRDADDTASALVKYIDRVLTRKPPLSFAAHSLGCRVALETVKQLDPGYKVREVALMAAAVDDDSLAWARAYRAAVRRAGRVAVLSARSDDVLRLAYPVGDLLQAFLFWRDEAGLALGYHGPRRHKATKADVPDNVSPLQIDRKGVNHGDYLPGKTPNKKQEAAAHWADAVLAGEPEPTYPR